MYGVTGIVIVVDNGLNQCVPGVCYGCFAGGGHILHQPTVSWANAAGHDALWRPSGLCPQFVLFVVCSVYLIVSQQDDVLMFQNLQGALLCAYNDSWICLLMAVYTVRPSFHLSSSHFANCVLLV